MTVPAVPAEPASPAITQAAGQDAREELAVTVATALRSGVTREELVGDFRRVLRTHDAPPPATPHSQTEQHAAYIELAQACPYCARNELG